MPRHATWACTHLPMLPCSCACTHLPMHACMRLMRAPIGLTSRSSSQPVQDLMYCDMSSSCPRTGDCRLSPTWGCCCCCRTGAWGLGLCRWPTLAPFPPHGLSLMACPLAGPWGWPVASEARASDGVREVCGRAGYSKHAWMKLNPRINHLPFGLARARMLLHRRWLSSAVARQTARPRLPLRLCYIIAEDVWIAAVLHSKEWAGCRNATRVCVASINSRLVKGVDKILCGMRQLVPTVLLP